MYDYPEALELLIENLRKLPSIGRKSAQRLALHFALMDDDSKMKLINSLIDTKEKIKRCRICGNLTDKEECSICLDSTRDDSTLCVVEDVTNLLSIERSATYKGKYHVLNGLINPSNILSPEEMGIDSFIDRINKSDLKEVIFAISPTVEGETTILFLKELLKNKNIKTTRIASGIPVGGNLEYYDDITLTKALEDRRDLDL